MTQRSRSQNVSKCRIFYYISSTASMPFFEQYFFILGNGAVIDFSPNSLYLKQILRDFREPHKLPTKYYWSILGSRYYKRKLSVVEFSSTFHNSSTYNQRDLVPKHSSMNAAIKAMREDTKSSKHYFKNLDYKLLDLGEWEVTL